MALTTIPEKTETSLGQVKQDVLPYTDPDTQVPAVQYERLKDAVIANALAIGLADGSTADSLVAELGKVAASRVARQIVFSATAVGDAANVVGAVYFSAGYVIDADSRALLGTVEGGSATLRLRAQSTGSLLSGASWSVTGALADVVLGGDVTVSVAGWYTIELLGDAQPTVSLGLGLLLI